MREVITCSVNGTLLYERCIQENSLGTSLVMQWLRLCTPIAGAPGSISGQGTPQLRLSAAK